MPLAPAALLESVERGQASRPSGVSAQQTLLSASATGLRSFQDARLMECLSG